jgi:hypothetical protein
MERPLNGTRKSSTAPQLRQLCGGTTDVPKRRRDANSCDPKQSWGSARRCGARDSTPFAAQDLPPLLVGQGDHYAVGVALEADLETD